MNVREASILMGADASFISASLFDKQITDFSIDSRSVKTGELFFALSQADYARAGFNGIFADAHDFIADAFSGGAIAAVGLSERVINDQKLSQLKDRLLLVDDAIAALQTLARRVYEAWGRPVIGITGSAGKTTAKELTAQVLSGAGRRVLKSERNYNNGLGLPLSVLRLVSAGHSPNEFDMAVLEMGMSSPTHEIRRLVEITPPDVGVELMVAPVHLEYLGSLENIAAAKAELIEGLKPNGIAVLNADDELVIKMRSKHAGRTVTFGIEQPADVNASQIDTSNLGLIRFQLHTPLGDAPAVLPMSGRHNLMNALAAAAVGTCFEITPAQIAAALKDAKPPAMRGSTLNFAAGFRVVDDSYNSNPRSLLSMVRTIVDGGSDCKRRIVIAGEMLELGPEAVQLHREVGYKIASSGVDVVWGVRGLAEDLVAGAKEGGLEQARFFSDSDQAAEAILNELKAGDLVLIKGSRGVATDKIVTAIKNVFPEKEQ